MSLSNRNIHKLLGEETIDKVLNPMLDERKTQVDKALEDFKVKIGKIAEEKPLPLKIEIPETANEKSIQTLKEAFKNGTSVSTTVIPQNFFSTPYLIPDENIHKTTKGYTKR